MGKISVSLDKTNPWMYVVSIENNDGNRIVFGCSDKEFHDFIDKLQTHKKFAQMDRERIYQNGERWK